MRPHWTPAALCLSAQGLSESPAQGDLAVGSVCPRMVRAAQPPASLGLWTSAMSGEGPAPCPPVPWPHVDSRVLSGNRLWLVGVEK